jgi:hypothetical protein
MYAIVVPPFLSAIRDNFRGRAVLRLELLALRHQMATLERTYHVLAIEQAINLANWKRKMIGFIEYYSGFGVSYFL